MNIGIVCYASIGGSGIMATELGKALAARGHRVHVLSSDTPVRFASYQPRLSFHRVDTPSYPLFREPQYVLSLANAIVQVSKAEQLDIVHAHYAIPHATAAYLARQVLGSTPGASVPHIITTLHGTDITLLGVDPSYSEIVRFGIEESDGVTAVSESLKRDTYRELRCSCDIEVIPNFIDCDKHRRQSQPELRASLAPRGEKLVIHVSNFRPVKRVDVAVDVFARVRRQVPARLLLVGDGPDVGKVQRLAGALGVAHDVVLLGEQDSVIPLLSVSDVFLLPSAQESFGLAALEAMACGVPVVASRVGGLSEVVDDGVSGCLHAMDDLDGMARSVIMLLTDEAAHARMAAAAVRASHDRYCDSKIVPMYEAYYEKIMGRFREMDRTHKSLQSDP
jgi:L-malate glycosyltransferase